MDGILIIGFLLAFFVGMFFLIRFLIQTGKRTTAEWERLGRELDLEAIPNTEPWYRRTTTLPELRGNIRGRAVRGWNFARGSGKSRVAYYAFSVACKCNMEMQLSSEHLFSGIAKFFGSQDVVLGYEDFDKRFMIKSNNENKTRELLHDLTLRRKIMDILPSNAVLHIKNNELYIEQVCVFYNQIVETYTKRVAFMLDLAERIEEV